MISNAELPTASGTEITSPTPIPVAALWNDSVNKKTNDNIARMAMCPPVMLAANRIVSANGFTNIPISSKGINKM